MKYELINTTKLHEGRTLYRIVALEDFGDVKKGDLGGYVKSVRNLSQSGNCWIYDQAISRDNARVIDNAKLRGNAIARDNTVIRDFSIVGHDAMITDYTEVGGRDVVNGTTRLDMEALK